MTEQWLEMENTIYIALHLEAWNELFSLLKDGKVKNRASLLLTKEIMWVCEKQSFQNTLKLLGPQIELGRWNAVDHEAEKWKHFWLSMTWLVLHGISVIISSFNGH